MKVESFELLYHGTDSGSWPQIERSAEICQGSSLCTDPAFALDWAIKRFGDAGVVLEVKISTAQKAQLQSGFRTGPIQCRQYTVINGMSLRPISMRTMSTDNLKVHRAYRDRQISRNSAI